MEGTHAGGVHEELQSMGRIHFAEIHGGPSPTLEQGMNVRSPLLEEEGAAEKMCDELTSNPIPHQPGPLQGGGGENQE